MFVENDVSALIFSSRASSWLRFIYCLKRVLQTILIFDAAKEVSKLSQVSSAHHNSLTNSLQRKAERPNQEKTMNVFDLKSALYMCPPVRIDLSKRNFCKKTMYLVSNVDIVYIEQHDPYFNGMHILRTLQSYQHFQSVGLR